MAIFSICNMHSSFKNVVFSSSFLSFDRCLAYSYVNGEGVPLSDIVFCFRNYLKQRTNPLVRENILYSCIPFLSVSCLKHEVSNWGQYSHFLLRLEPNQWIENLFIFIFMSLSQIMECCLNNEGIGNYGPLQGMHPFPN